jgi:hypothetical protein
MGFRDSSSRLLYPPQCENTCWGGGRDASSPLSRLARFIGDPQLAEPTKTPRRKARRRTPTVFSPAPLRCRPVRDCLPGTCLAWKFLFTRLHMGRGTEGTWGHGDCGKLSVDCRVPEADGSPTLILSDDLIKFWPYQSEQGRVDRERTRIACSPNRLQRHWHATTARAPPVTVDVLGSWSVSSRPGWRKGPAPRSRPSPISPLPFFFFFSHKSRRSSGS